jgi:dihydrofolate synthase / folylpolyglutamate synthase
MKLKQYQQFQDAINYLESLGNLTDANFFAGTSDPNFHFARAKHLLKLGGNPDKALKIIHVTGTSGKGTTTNLIYNILQANGHKVGAHFSPYVSVPTEKIQINNKFISVSEFIKLVEEVKPIIQKCYESYGPPSYFETWLLMTLLYFKKKNCDYVVLEVGCGGRFDATNAVSKTLVSVITNIGLDHTHIIGKTYKKIAFEKAGIIRSKGKVFTTTDNEAALKVIEEVAQKQNADLTVLQKQDDPNEALAIAVAAHLKIGETKIIKGLKETKLPGRFETIQSKPLIIIDGAHNPDKIKFLTQKVKKLKYNKLHLICGLTNFKKPKDVFAELLPLVTSFYITRFTASHRKVTPPLEIKKALNSKKPTQIFLDPQEALAAALKKAKNDDLILITGSFFLCGELRKNWIKEIDQLDLRKSFLK